MTAVIEKTDRPTGALALVDDQQEWTAQQQAALVQIVQVSQKVQEGIGRGGAPWKRYSMKIKFVESGLESWASTFSEGANTLAEQYRGNGLSLLMNYKENTRGDVTYINVEDFVEVSNG